MQTKNDYIGERFDTETGLMYLNARYYDPVFGKFISTDDAAEGPEEDDLFTRPYILSTSQVKPTGIKLTPSN